MSVTKLPVTETTKKQELTELIEELTTRMVKALDKSEVAEEQGKETATFADIKAALSTVCDVYRLLNTTGDLDTSGNALEGYRKRFANGRSDKTN